MRWLRSSSTTLRSDAITSSVSTRPVMRSASNSIMVPRVLARDALEVAGVVVAGEGVLLAADGRELLREAAGRILRGALEHQVFEEMRDARTCRADRRPRRLRYQSMWVTTGVR